MKNFGMQLQGELIKGAVIVWAKRSYETDIASLLIQRPKDSDLEHKFSFYQSMPNEDKYFEMIEYNLTKRQAIKAATKEHHEDVVFAKKRANA